MWHCVKCNENIDDQFDSCWKCGRPKAEVQGDAASPPAAPPTADPAAAKKDWRMAYKYFRGMLASWDELFTEAAQFATEVGPERVVGISHSCDDSDGVVTVWYWTEAETPGPVDN